MWSILFPFDIKEHSLCGLSAVIGMYVITLVLVICQFFF